MKTIIRFIACITLLWVAVACATATPPLAPTPSAFSLPTLFPPTPVPPTATPIPTATLPPTLTPTETALPTVVVATPTSIATPIASLPTLTPTSTPTPLPTFTRTATASPTPAIPPGLYVTSLRTDPDPPLRGPALKFIPTFVNTLGGPQGPRWEVYIFRADAPNRFIGETTRTDTPIPVGTVEVPSLGSWTLPLGGPCDYFFAQVGWTNAENKIIWFNTTSNQVFQKGFTVCPP